MADAKELAARHGSSVSALVNEALREKIRSMESSTRPERAFKMLTYGHGSCSLDLSPADMAEMVAEDDMRVYEQR